MDVLASTERMLQGEKRKQAEKLLDRANGYLARFNLDIASDTSVVIDSAATDLDPGSELVLEMGDHRLEFRAAGRPSSAARWSRPRSTYRR